MPNKGFKTITIRESIYNICLELWQESNTSSFSSYMTQKLNDDLYPIIPMRFVLKKAYPTQIIIYDTWQKKTLIINNAKDGMECSCMKKHNCLHIGYIMSLWQTASWKYNPTP